MPSCAVAVITTLGRKKKNKKAGARHRRRRTRRVKIIVFIALFFHGIFARQTTAKHAFVTVGRVLRGNASETERYARERPRRRVIDSQTGRAGETDINICPLVPARTRE